MEAVDEPSLDFRRFSFYNAVHATTITHQR